MSKPKYPRTYYARQGCITGPCYLYSHANNCDIPAPEGNYVRESDYAELRTERDRLKEQREYLLYRKTQLRDVCDAVWQWWRTKRPADYTPEMHHKHPHVNTISDTERLMIDAVLASLTQQEGGTDE